MNKFLLMLALCFSTGLLRGEKDPETMIEEMREEQRNLLNEIERTKTQNIILHGKNEYYYTESILEIALTGVIVGLLLRHVENNVYKIIAAIPCAGVIIRAIFWNIISNYVADANTQERVDKLGNRYAGLERSIRDINSLVRGVPLAPLRTSPAPETGLTRFIKNRRFGVDQPVYHHVEPDEGS